MYPNNITVILSKSD